MVIDKCDPDLEIRADIAGSYDNHQSGLVLHNVSSQDAGNWTCEVRSRTSVFPVYMNAIILDGGIPVWRLGDWH